MMMVTQPPVLVGGRAPDQSTSFVGVVAALFSALTAAGVNITISKLKGEPATTITLYAMLGSIIVAFPGFCYHQLGPHGQHRLWHASKAVLAQLCLTGVLSTVAQVSKTSGLKMSKSFGVLVMRYLDIFFAFIWDLAFLHAEIDALSVCGALVIVAGCMASILLKKGGG
jgi:drug/metabolite transporter (DMT)-like permease